MYLHVSGMSEGVRHVWNTTHPMPVRVPRGRQVTVATPYTLDRFADVPDRYAEVQG